MERMKLSDPPEIKFEAQALQSLGRGAALLLHVVTGLVHKYMQGFACPGLTEEQVAGHVGVQLLAMALCSLCHGILEVEDLPREKQVAEVTELVRATMADMVEGVEFQAALDRARRAQCEHGSN
jgi:hypothetical protein